MSYIPRSSGILMPIFSLPSPYGIGTKRKTMHSQPRPSLRAASSPRWVPPLRSSTIPKIPIPKNFSPDSVREDNLKICGFGHGFFCCGKVSVSLRFAKDRVYHQLCTLVLATIHHTPLVLFGENAQKLWHFDIINAEKDENPLTFAAKNGTIVLQETENVFSFRFQKPFLRLVPYRG